MTRHALVQKLEQEQLKKDLPDVQIGDTISVQLKIVEGDKERLQTMSGVVISIKGTGLSKMITLYRVAYGQAMERIFPIHSPRVAKIEIVKRGKVRRAKLNYLRGASGKAARVKGIQGPGKAAKNNLAAAAPQEQESEAVIIEEQTTIIEQDSAE